MSNPKPIKGRCTNSPTKKPTCGNCGKKHYSDYLIGMDNCFSCGKSGHNVKDCPSLKSLEKGSGQVQESGSNVDGPNKKCFYSLHFRGEQEFSRRGD